MAVKVFVFFIVANFGLFIAAVSVAEYEINIAVLRPWKRRACVLALWSAHMLIAARAIFQ